MRRPIVWIAVMLVALSATLWMVVSAQEDTTTAPPTLEDMLPITADIRYEVGVGDTLDGIAALFDVRLDCLAESNGIDDPNRILLGTILVIRVACPPYNGGGYVAFPRDIVLVEQGGGSAETVYVVRVADTLEEIAQAFDVSLISLVEYNDIVDTRTVLVGDILVIPPGAPAYGLVPPLPGQVTESGGGGNDIIYVIQPRDTLDTVGAFYNAEPRCIAAANGIINTRTIQPRTTILIPEVCAPYVGPNVAGGRLIPIEGEPTIAATVLLSSTPRPTLAPSATFPAPEGTATVATRVSTVVATPTVESLGAGGGAESTATSTLAASATATNTRPPSVTPTSTIVATVAVTSTRPPSTATIIPTPTIEILVTATP